MPNVKAMFKELVKMPKLSSLKDVLFVGPHPDDIEFGCGALISKIKENGGTVHFLIVTDGSSGTDDPLLPPSELKKIREKEATDAAFYLKADSIDFIGFEDGGLFTSEDVTREVAKYIMKYAPDAVFSPDPHLRNECHNDHIKTGEGVRGAMQIVAYPEALKRHHVETKDANPCRKPIVLVYYFTDYPNAFEEVSKKNVGDKLSALSLHKSQMSGDSKMLLDYFLYKARQDGKKHHVLLAEVFQVIIPICQHVYSDGLKM